MEKIIHVHLIFEKKDYYFGSIAAIYTVLTPEQMGVKYNTLRNAKWKDISVYQTQRAIIKQGEIIRSKQLWASFIFGTIKSNRGGINQLHRLYCFHFHAHVIIIFQISYPTIHQPAIPSNHRFTLHPPSRKQLRTNGTFCFSPTLSVTV